MPPKRRQAPVSGPSAPPKRPRRTDVATPASTTSSARPRKRALFTKDRYSSRSSSSLSSLTDSEDETTEETGKRQKDGGKVREEEQEEEDDDDDEDGDGEEWEDVLAAVAPVPQQPPSSSLVPREGGDLELTLDRTGMESGSTGSKRKGATLEQRRIRMLTHCTHVQFLLFHGAIRNYWINDALVQALLLSHVPPAILRDVERFHSGAAEISSKVAKLNRKGKTKAAAALLSEASPTPASDRLVKALGALIHWWKKKFAVTAPGLRKRGYRSYEQLAEERDEPAAEKFRFTTGKRDASGEELFSVFKKQGETVGGLEEFREMAAECRGSRDTGAVFFTALCRALGLQARMVFSLQPLGFGFTNAEEMTAPKTPLGKEKPPKEPKKPQKRKKKKRKNRKKEESSSESEATFTDSDLDEGSDSSVASGGFIRRPKKPKSASTPAPHKSASFDKDLPYPIFWTEIYSPRSKTFLSVSSLTLTLVGSTPEVFTKFSPRGTKAAAAKQVHAYIVSYSADGSAKDVTVRYLPNRALPGKTKPFRVPASEVPIYAYDGSVVGYRTVDWWGSVLRGYRKPFEKLTDVDCAEDESLQPVLAEKKEKKPSESVSGYKNHPDYVLERHLRRDEALLPGCRPVKTLLTGKKGSTQTEEKVYRRDDVVFVKAAEAWYKEGRTIPPDEKPIKVVKRRAVTASKRKELQDAERDGDAAAGLQGLFAGFQTQLYVPPPVIDGVVPRNEFGNVDLYVPSMLPKGGVHVNLKGAAKVARKLGISYADAVTGFEFRRQRAVPFVEGVVVAREMEGLVRDAWVEEERERRRKEQGKREKEALAAWRRFLHKLRVLERFREEFGYGADGEEDGELGSGHGLFGRRTKAEKESEKESGEAGGGFVPEDERADEHAGGGFLPDSDDENHEDPGPGGFLPDSPPDPAPGGFILDLEEEAHAVPTHHPPAPASKGPLRSLRDALSAQNPASSGSPEDSSADERENTESEGQGEDGDADDPKQLRTNRRGKGRQKRKAALKEEDEEGSATSSSYFRQQPRTRRRRTRTTAKAAENAEGTRRRALGAPEVQVVIPVTPRNTRSSWKAPETARTRTRSRYFTPRGEDDEDGAGKESGLEQDEDEDDGDEDEDEDGDEDFDMEM